MHIKVEVMQCLSVKYNIPETAAELWKGDYAMCMVPIFLELKLMIKQLKIVIDRSHFIDQSGCYRSITKSFVRSNFIEQTKF